VTIFLPNTRACLLAGLQQRELDLGLLYGKVTHVTLAVFLVGRVLSFVDLAIRISLPPGAGESGTRPRPQLWRCASSAGSRMSKWRGARRHGTGPYAETGDGRAYNSVRRSSN
jgi:hypothetical protein